MNNRKKRNYWNYEKCYIKAKQCDSKSEFKKVYPTAYSKCTKNGWINDFYWLKDRRLDLFNGKIDSVYVYEFTDFNTAYIGRTLMRLQKKRDYDHIYKDNDPIHKFAKINNIAIPYPKYIEENLTIEEGRNRECFWIEEYKKNGWNLLNKAKGGSIGGLGSVLLKYTYDVCFEIAKNCYSRSEFEKQNASAYRVAKQKNWIDDYHWFIRKIKPSGYWNYEHCYEEAKKHKTIVSFQKSSNQAYQMSIKNNWIDDYFWFDRKLTKKLFWNDYEKCYNEARKYKKINHFRQKSRTAFEYAKRNDWLKDYIWFNKRIVKPNGYWDVYENCLNESKKYLSKKDLRLHNQPCYKKSVKHGWIDDFFKQKIPANS